MYIYGRENKSSKDIIVCREKRRKKKKPREQNEKLIRSNHIKLVLPPISLPPSPFGISPFLPYMNSS